uniref:Leucine--tRNA ligase n=1 Tax=candidate division WWE3 bacterium TaxID=2053526 RepID=A0A831Z237_UNCKA
MSETFDHRKIEPKWQKVWEKENLYRAVDFSEKKKQYILVEFPYPSGERLHVGHGRTYCCLDAVARLQRMRGYNVLFPIGWDAFGLPAENYAIKTGIHPSVTTKENIANSKKQAQSWGLSFDWEREIRTTDPDYYRWTQWIFLQLFQKGLAYKAEVPVNWCPSCKINLADEEVVVGDGQLHAASDLASPGGKCERCGTPVTRRRQSQWMLKITAYADRLIDDLTKVDYRKDIQAQQINWIGRSGGVQIKFQVSGSKSQAVEVFTTRPDTLYGVTFLVLSPEKAQELLDWVPSSSRPEVEKYIRQALAKSELRRQEEIKDKTGVFTGIHAQHPLTGEKLPVWVADFVLSGYGTGAIMAVPAHDQRDFEFAKKYDLPIREVIKNSKLSKFPKEPFTGEGELVNSSQFDGLQSTAAIDKITRFLVVRKLGQKSVDYKLRDWVFSRQHYWGEPIPVIFCRKCWEVKSQKSKIKMKEGYDFVKINGEEHAINPVPEEDLPVELPYIENYKPTGTGESPLAAVEEWVKVPCPICGKQARRETDTMPNWAGSSWYYLAYAFWHKRGGQRSEIRGKRFENAFAKYEREIDYWMPIDWYNGGMEHTTLHLLYSRFWYKFLFDLRLVPGPEPYAKRTSHGVVLGPDGQKMSKSRGNVINPDEVVAEFGADTFRGYEAFMGPFEQTISWDPKGVLGVHRFLDKVWKAHQEVIRRQVTGDSGKLRRKLHQLIKKVEEDTLSLKFNTAVAAMMGWINQLSISNYQLSISDWGIFLRVLAPYAPHLAEELYQSLKNPKSGTRNPKITGNRKLETGNFESIHRQPWPKYDPKLIAKETVTIIVQVDGKMRGKLEVPAGTGEVEVKKISQDLATVKPHLYGREVAKTIFIPDNLINFVTR